MKPPKLLIGQDEYIGQWVGERIPHVGGDNFGKRVTVGIVDHDCSRLLAGVVYHDYQPDFGTIQLSIAAVSPLWAHSQTIGDFLAFPFYQYGCHKVWTAIAHTNEKALRANYSAGFKREAVLAHHFGPKVHAVISRMLKHDYQRIYEHGQKDFVSTRAT